MNGIGDSLRGHDRPKTTIKERKSGHRIRVPQNGAVMFRAPMTGTTPAGRRYLIRTIAFVSGK